MMPALSLDRAVVVRQDDGSVVVDDPECPVTITLVVDSTVGTRPRLVSLTVAARGPGDRITAKGLGRLPVPQLVHLAALRTPATHPNEDFWRALVTPKPYGDRDWPDQHWRTVWEVYRWADSTGRPGGGFQAIADLWCVARRPTAYRWLARARKVVQADDLQV
jgi:hypothetical protein